ncbi:MAG: primosomal replication protein PriC [Psychrobium sp.]
MRKELNKIREVLSKLATDAQIYDQTNIIPDLARKALFEDRLFKSQSRQLSHYVKESQALVIHVQALIDSNSANSIIAFQCEKLVDQCQAIKKALSSQELQGRSYKIDKASKAKRFAKKQQNSPDNFKWLAQKIMSNSQHLYQELSKHHEYRSRFNQRIHQLNEQLAKANQGEKIGLQQEILKLQKRLGQCNKAIYFIEQKIENLEKGKRPF